MRRRVVGGKYIDKGAGKVSRVNRLSSESFSVGFFIRFSVIFVILVFICWLGMD